MQTGEGFGERIFNIHEALPQPQTHILTRTISPSTSAPLETEIKLAQGGGMGAEAKRYLQEHSIPQLFEGLMTGLIYNKPEDPIQFLEGAITKVRSNPGLALKWDSFVHQLPPEQQESAKRTAVEARKGGTGTAPKKRGMEEEQQQQEARPRPSAAISSTPSSRLNRDSSQPSRKNTGANSQPQNAGMRSRQNSWSNKNNNSNSAASPSASSSSRPGSLAQAANSAYIPPDAPIILFMGGPGGGKTRYASKLQEALKEEGVVHICMPDLVRQSIARYKDRLPEWRVAAERYQRGELIPNELAQQLVKAEMGRHPHAKAFFLEGFPREARQVEDFELNVRPVNMALILDYDEEVLRRHMQSRGLLSEVIDRRIDEFKQKTLPSAKYFDDQRLLHLIPGEKEDDAIIERMKKLVLRAIRAGVHSSARTRHNVNSASSGEAAAAAINGPENTEQRMAPLEEAAVLGEDKMGGGGEPPAANNASKPSSKPPSAATSKSSAHSRPISASRTKEEHPSSRSNSKTSQRPKTSSASASGEAKRAGSSADAQRTKSGSAGANDAIRRTSQATVKSGGSGGRLGSSTVSTPKPSEGAYRDLMSNSSNKKAPMNGGGASNPTLEMATNESDSLPKGMPADVPVVLIIGAPGSSKSKFAQRIAKKYDGFVFISLGELLRRKLLQNGEDELWIRIGKKMDAGEMIPMRICRELLYTAIHERGASSWGLVIEGYPRTLPQVLDVEAQLGRLDLAILIDCTEAFCKDALRRRYQKDKEEGAERADDDENIVRVRLAQFKQNTLPMLKHLDDTGRLRVVRLEGPAEMLQIEGDTDEDKVFHEMCSLIDNTIFIQDDGNGKSLGSTKQNSVDEADQHHQPTAAPNPVVAAEIPEQTKEEGLTGQN